MTQETRFTPRPDIICATVKASFKDAAFVYKNGSCFEFFLILRTIFPHAKAWTDFGHVWVEIDGEFWDIDGKRTEGADGLIAMATEPALLKRAFRWKYGTKWRVDVARMQERNDGETGLPKSILGATVYPDRDHLEIEHDGTATWADLQWVKNHVWGQEALAEEFYPPESRVVNGRSETFHYRHLWRRAAWSHWPDIRPEPREDIPEGYDVDFTADGVAL